MVPLDRDFIRQSAAVLLSLLRTYSLCTKLPDRNVNRRSVFQFPPHLPLLVPVERSSHGAVVGIFDRVTDLGCSWQEEDLFLDVGREIVEPHDWRHACRRDLSEVGEF